jgi:hypothetical protein
MNAAEQERRSRLAEQSCATVQHGSHIDSLPMQPLLPVNRAPVIERRSPWAESPEED